MSRRRSSFFSALRHPTMTTYVVAFVALIALTTLTLALSFLPHGPWAVPVTVAIALLKSVAIALVFMHLAEEPASSWIALLVALLLLATLLALATLDVTSRWLLLRGR